MENKTEKQKNLERILDFLEASKLHSQKFRLGRKYYADAEKAILKISKETHNFPHYTTCQTCEDGWDMQIDFLIKELKLWAKGRLVDKPPIHSPTLKGGVSLGAD